MVNEVEFHDNASQWEMWRKDGPGYLAFLNGKIENREERSHGFRYRGQYQEQIAEMTKPGAPPAD